MNAPLSGAPLTAPHVTTGGLCRWKAINMVGRHVGLDFYDLLIEAISRFDRWSLSATGMFRQLRVLGEVGPLFEDCRYQITISIRGSCYAQFIRFVSVPLGTSDLPVTQ